MSLRDCRKGWRRPLLVVVHVEVLGAAVTIRVFAVRMVEVRCFRISAPDQGVLVRALVDWSPSKDVSQHAWWPAKYVLLFDPFGMFDHGRVVVEGDRLPVDTSKPFAVGLYPLIDFLDLGSEFVDVEGKGFTDDLGNGLVWGCRWYRLLRMTRGSDRLLSRGLTRATRSSLRKSDRL